MDTIRLELSLRPPFREKELVVAPPAAADLHVEAFSRLCVGNTQGDEKKKKWQKKKKKKKKEKEKKKKKKNMFPLQDVGRTGILFFSSNC